MYEHRAECVLTIINPSQTTCWKSRYWNVNRLFCYLNDHNENIVDPSLDLLHFTSLQAPESECLAQTDYSHAVWTALVKTPRRMNLGWGQCKWGVHRVRELRIFYLGAASSSVCRSKWAAVASEHAEEISRFGQGVKHIIVPYCLLAFTLPGEFTGNRASVKWF